MATRRWETDDTAVSIAPRTQQPEGVQEDADDQEQPEQQSNTLTIDKPTGRRKRKALTESHLLSNEGFKKMYRTFPYQVSGGVAGNEAKALNQLIKLYKQWAYDLYPGLNFEDFIDRTEALGKTHSVQGLMNDLREKEAARVSGNARQEEEHDDHDTIDNQIAEQLNDDPFAMPASSVNASERATQEESSAIDHYEEEDDDEQEYQFPTPEAESY